MANGVDEPTTFIKKDPVTGNMVTEASTILGVSVRGWIAIMLIVTICLNQLGVTTCAVIASIGRNDLGLLGTYTSVGEPLYSLAIAALGFYFGSNRATPKEPSNGAKTP